MHWTIIIKFIAKEDPVNQKYKLEDIDFGNEEELKIQSPLKLNKI